MTYIPIFVSILIGVTIISFLLKSKSRNKIVFWIFGPIIALSLALWLILIVLDMSSSSDSTAKSRALTEDELSQSLNHLSPGIRLIAGFEASEYGGWHGDGGSVSIYLANPDDTDALIAGLKKFHKAKQKQYPEDDYTYNYKWIESSRPNLSSLDHQIPKKFRPKSEMYIIGRCHNGEHTISIGKQTGFVCFAYSRS